MTPVFIYFSASVPVEFPLSWPIIVKQSSGGSLSCAQEAIDKVARSTGIGSGAWNRIIGQDIARFKRPFSGFHFDSVNSNSKP